MLKRAKDGLYHGKTAWFYPKGTDIFAWNIDFKRGIISGKSRKDEATAALLMTMLMSGKCDYEFKRDD